MDLIYSLKGETERIWEPVLKPKKKPIINDQMGFGYLHAKNEQIYKRHDDCTVSFDNQQLVFTSFLRITNPSTIVSKTEFSLIERDENGFIKPEVTSKTKCA